MVNSQVSEARDLIVKDFGLDKSSGETTLEELIHFISIQVEDLLRNDMSRLMSILYRVDVAEQKVKKAFSDSVVADLPMVLAALIMERELQKIESRKRFSGGQSQDL